MGWTTAFSAAGRYQSSHSTKVRARVRACVCESSHDPKSLTLNRICVNSGSIAEPPGRVSSVL